MNRKDAENLVQQVLADMTTVRHFLDSVLDSALVLRGDDLVHNLTQVQRLTKVLTTRGLVNRSDDAALNLYKNEIPRYLDGILARDALRAVNKYQMMGISPTPVKAETEEDERIKRMDSALEEIKRAVEVLNRVDYNLFVDPAVQMEFLDARSTLEDIRDRLIKRLLKPHREENS